MAKQRQAPATLGDTDPKVELPPDLTLEDVAPDPDTTDADGQPNPPPADETPQEPKDEPTVEVVKDTVTVEKPAVWKTIESLSDDEMEVEAAAIQARQLFKVILRFRVDGKLTGAVMEVDRMHVVFDKQTGKYELQSRM